MEHSLETGSPSSNSSEPEYWTRLQEEQQSDYGYEDKIYHNSLSYHQLKTAAEREARIYMSSYPMNDSAAKNIPLHNSITSLFGQNPRPSYFSTFEGMIEGIDHRMNQIMGAATRYKDFWALDMPDCHQVDVDAVYFRGSGIDSFSLVVGYGLFDGPSERQNHSYIKGCYYIALCIDRAGWDLPEATAKLDALILYKTPCCFPNGVSNIEGTSRVKAMAQWIMHAHARTIRTELQKISRCTGLRIRRASSSSQTPEKSLLKKAAPRLVPSRGEYRFGPDGRALSRDELIPKITSAAEIYLDSYPGIDSKAKNISLHTDLYDLIRGSRIPNVIGLGYLHDQIYYRLNYIMGAATAYKEAWGLDLPNCEAMNVDKRLGTGSARWITMLKLVQSYPLFDAPHEQGHTYSKGEWYLACCIYHENWSKVQAEEKLKYLVRFKDAERERMAREASGN
ncbi:hypothetical protein V494_08271 [Pseudogymnoascus sp. VKM F-4513 (FW-928)]|nr:hypothetical protein V494_08271 [Pseudogymnoascus sp. VKM F-4513 (FW-928)]